MTLPSIPSDTQEYFNNNQAVNNQSIYEDVLLAVRDLGTEIAVNVDLENVTVSSISSSATATIATAITTTLYPLMRLLSPNFAGTASSGTSTSLVDNNADYTANMFGNDTAMIKILSAESGKIYGRYVASNTADTLYFASLTGYSITAGDTYSLNYPV